MYCNTVQPDETVHPRSPACTFPIRAQQLLLVQQCSQTAPFEHIRLSLDAALVSAKSLVCATAKKGPSRATGCTMTLLKNMLMKRKPTTQSLS